MATNNFFLWNKKRSVDFGLRLKNAISIPHPKRVYSETTAPGVDGVILEDEERFECVDFNFPCKLYASKDYIGDKTAPLFECEQKIVEWLMSAKGWNELAFSDHADWIYRAVYLGGGKVDRITKWLANMDISFRLFPFKFERQSMILKKHSGSLGFSTFEFVNPYQFDAKPELQITGTGYVRIIFTNGIYRNELVISDLNGTVNINTEHEIAYYGAVNLSNHILSYPYPVLKNGTTKVEIIGSVGVFNIKPCLRTLV